MDEKGIEGPESPKKGPQVPKSLSHEALVLEHFRLKSGMMASDSLDDDTAEVIKSAENQGEMDGEAAFQKFRLEQPEVNNYDRGNATRLHDVIHDNAAFEKALEQFKEDKIASSNKAAHDSRRGWWSSKAALMNLQAYPMTPQSVDVMGTLLKIGKYRSAALYFSAAKQMHIEQGHVWDNRLDQAVKSALRSCLRGIGPDKKCPSFDLTKVCDMKPVEPCSGGPRFPKEAIIVFAHFACREVEASVRLRKDILLTEGPVCGIVSLWLPASKTDPKGNGCLRRHGCTCQTHPDRCPVRAARKIYDYGTMRGATDDDPFLSTEDVKQPPTKAAMIEAFRMVAKALGWKSEEVKAMTGHVLRPTGAQYLARCGVEYYKVQLFCRWGSDTILRYLREAPLEDSEAWVADSLKKASVTEVLCQTAMTMNQESDEATFASKNVDHL